MATQSDSKNSFILRKLNQFTFIDLFISILVLGLFLIFIYIRNEYLNTYNSTKHETLKVAQIVSLQVDASVRNIKNILILTSDEITQHNIFKFKQKELLKFASKRLLLAPDLDTILISDKDGNAQAAAPNRILKFNVSDRAYFKTLKEANDDRLYFSEQLKSRFSNNMVSVYSHRIEGADNEFSGVISASVPLDSWEKYFQDNKNEIISEINIVGLDNCTIIGTTSQKDQQFNSEFINSDFCKKNIPKTNYALKESFIDEVTNNIISYVTIPEFKIAIVTISTPRKFLHPYYKKNIIILLLCLLIGLSYWKLINIQRKIELSLKEKELQMINSSKMATLGEMASGVAHEINNPLTIIKGRLQQANRFTNPTSPDLDAIKRALSISLLATDRITKIVQGMKSISRGSSLDEKIPTSLENIFSDTLIFCQEKFKHHNIELNIAEIPDLEIDCIESQISQVILNLLNNSFDAIVGTDPAWIKIEFIDNENLKSVSIIFTDSGRGIPKEIADNIMLPFFTTKTVGKGTGLGLSISTRIIKEHQGELSYNSKSANTQFIIKLPYLAS